MSAFVHALTQPISALPIQPLGINPHGADGYVEAAGWKGSRNLTPVRATSRTLRVTSVKSFSPRQSARGLAQSKTLRISVQLPDTRSVLDCGSPLPLSQLRVLDYAKHIRKSAIRQTQSASEKCAATYPPP